MPHFVALHNQQHQAITIDTSKIEAQGAREHMVPVVLSEFLKLVVSYPIVFTKSADTGQFLAVALLGFDSGENLFWQDQQWQSIYVPLNISRQPFFVGSEAGEAIICIDTLSPCIGSSANNDTSNDVTTDKGDDKNIDKNHARVFDSEGKDSAYLQSIKSQLAQLLDGEPRTVQFIRTLRELNLIVPLTLDICFANQQEQRVQGLYSIDEERLAQLNAEQLLQLHQQHYLQPIYTMVASLGHIYTLIQKKNEQLGYA